VERLSHAEQVLKSVVDSVESGQALYLLKQSVKRAKCYFFETFRVVLDVLVIQNVKRVHEPVENRLGKKENDAGGPSNTRLPLVGG